MKVMIVDDEVIIRTGLRTVVEWEENGFTVLEPAASAEEAWTRFPSERPDIVLTDIRMTGMDGLELASLVSRQYPDTEIVILTGYDDFQYAQQAIREGVGDYLLKTSGPEEILNSVLNAKQRRLRKLESTEKDQVQKAAYRNLMLERLATEGANGERNLEAMKALFPRLFPASGAEEPQRLQVVLVSLSGWEDMPGNDGLLLFAADNMLGEMLPCETLVRPDHLLAVARHDPSYEKSYRIESILKTIRGKLKCSAFAAAGPCVDSVGELNLSYAGALSAYSYKGLLGGNATVFYEDVKSRSGGRRLCSREEEAELVSILKAGNPDDLRRWIGRVAGEEAKGVQATPESLTAFANSIVLAAHRWLERVLDPAGSPVSARGGEFAAESRDGQAGLEERLFGRLNAIMDLYRVSNPESKGAYVRRAIDYIREHLDKNLSLQQVAKFVHVNPNHFSEVFKRETGLTYIEFVTRERMVRAEEILNESDAKIGEVANRVGYEDIKYFGRQFKKHTGKTPSEYREKI